MRVVVISCEDHFACNTYISPGGRADREPPVYPASDEFKHANLQRHVPSLAVARLCLVRATPLMIASWLTFIAVGLVTYLGFLKLAARLLRHSVSWKASFLFAAFMLVLVIFEHLLVFSEPIAIRIGHSVLLLGLMILGSWFFSRRGTNCAGAVLGWSGGIRLMALAFAMMIVVAFAIVIPVQVFLTNHLSRPP